MSYLFDSYAKIYDHFMRLFHLDDTSVQVIIGTKVTTVRNALDNLI